MTDAGASRYMKRMAKRIAPSRPFIDSLTMRSIGVEADADVRSVRRELEQPGSVRGRAGERVRMALARRGLQGGSRDRSHSEVDHG